MAEKAVLTLAFLIVAIVAIRPSHALDPIKGAACLQAVSDRDVITCQDQKITLQVGAMLDRDPTSDDPHLGQLFQLGQCEPLFPLVPVQFVKRETLSLPIGKLEIVTLRLQSRGAADEIMYARPKDLVPLASKTCRADP